MTKVGGEGGLIAAEISEHALAQAKRLGARHTVNPSCSDAKVAIYEILPAGPDLVIEAAEPVQAVELTVSLLRRGSILSRL